MIAFSLESRSREWWSSNSTLANSTSGLRHRLHFLPRYSPQLNPIEYCFAIWKTDAKSASMRTTVDLLHQIDEGAKRITPTVTGNIFAKVVDDEYPRTLNRSDF